MLRRLRRPRRAATAHGLGRRKHASLSSWEKGTELRLNLPTKGDIGGNVFQMKCMFFRIGKVVRFLSYQSSLGVWCSSGIVCHLLQRMVPLFIPCTPDYAILVDAAGMSSTTWKTLLKIHAANHRKLCQFQHIPLGNFGPARMLEKSLRRTVHGL